MKKNIIGIIVLVVTVVSFVIDVAVAATSGHLAQGLILFLCVVELFTCWVAYQVVQRKGWAIITLLVYYGIRSFNVYGESFRFYSKTGLNIEVRLGGALAINVITFLCFVLLIRELAKINLASPKRL
ncbi:hypothetical protein KK062_00120 [Fulvivirgaceae bacterium PWU5]|uniref:Uncharacterized protein n=1 Tax=Dawidia cretensis TaxID=2782350 RepID=A0AAP2GMN2_9BACT|nr:hypothetical protein [Dawidia cretensis]MBT1706601.1 hypothetical protein [Dawidia cretensis]